MEQTTISLSEPNAMIELLSKYLKGYSSFLTSKSIVRKKETLLFRDSDGSSAFQPGLEQELGFRTIAAKQGFLVESQELHSA